MLGAEFLSLVLVVFQRPPSGAWELGKSRTKHSSRIHVCTAEFSSHGVVIMWREMFNKYNLMVFTVGRDVTQEKNATGISLTLQLAVV